MSYIVSMIKYCLYLIWIKGVPDVVHVGLVTLSPFRELVWEKVSHARLLEDLIIESLNANFIIGWRIAKLHVWHLQELLLSRQDLLEMIFGKHFNWRQIELSI